MDWEDLRHRIDFGAIFTLGLAAVVAIGAWVVVGMSGKPSSQSISVPTPSASSPASDASAPTPDVSPAAGVTVSASASPSASPSGSPSASPSASASDSTDAAAAALEITLTRMGSTTTDSGSHPTIIDAHIVDPLGGIAGYTFSFSAPGSGQAAAAPRSAGGVIDSYSVPCAAKSWVSKPVDTHIQFKRSFRVPMTYTAYIAVQVGSCTGISNGYGGVPRLGGNAVKLARMVYGISGPEWPNGPMQPQGSISFERTRYEDGKTQDLGPGPQFRAYDDGVIMQMTVDWGDGDVENVPFAVEDSGQGTNGGCGAVNEFGAPDMNVVARPPVMHTYSSDGTYTVRLTITSATCGTGANAQTSQVSAQYTQSG